VRLPNSQSAVVDIAKLRDYCLNASHPRGKHKARVFAATLGLTSENADRLRDMILSSVEHLEVTQSTVDEHGTRYAGDFDTEGLVGTVTIRTAWIVDTDDTVPRLVTCYVREKS
jgi:hypothetical protein